MCVCLQGYDQWLTEVVAYWRGSQNKQSYSYLIKKNITNSFTWSFQRMRGNSEVGMRSGHWGGGVPGLLGALVSSIFIVLTGAKTQQ